MRIRMAKLLVVTGLTLSWGAAQTVAESGGPAAVDAKNESDATETKASRRLRDVWVPIVAFLDVPLASADVEIYDTKGQLLFRKQVATNARGVFPAFVKRLPRNFRVVLSWEPRRNSDRRELGGLDLSADVQDFDPARDVIHVNAVTTLVSRVLDRSPHMGVRRAQVQVRRFLGLQPNQSLGAALRQGVNYRSRQFAHSALLTEAVKNGGVDVYLSRLARRVVNEPDATQTFVGAPQGIFSSAAAFVARNLASGAISWAAGKGMGWVAESAGLSVPGATVNDIANLQSSLSDLQSSIDDLKDDIASLESQLSLEIQNAGYQNIVAQAQGLANEIDPIATRLTFYAADCPTVPEGVTPPAPTPYCEQNKQAILSQLNDPSIYGAFEKLAGWIVDNPSTGFNGLIHTYSVIMGKSIRFFRPADSTKMQAYADYWDASLVQAVTLKIEYFHLMSYQTTPGGISQIQGVLGIDTANPPVDGTMQKARNQEAQAVLPPVPENTVIDTKTKLMWRTQYPISWPSCTTAPASNGNHPFTESTTWNGMTGWSSPLYSDLTTLVDSNPGDPMNYLIQQTRTTPSESPSSQGFQDLVWASGNTQPGWSYCTTTPWVWSVDVAPAVNGFAARYAMNFQNGTKNAAATNTAITTYQLWIVLRRPLDLKNNERYYWYN